MSAHQPDDKRPVPDGRIPLTELVAMKRRGEPIVVVTAYDAPGARLAEAAGVNVILVGDSAAMTVLGHESTLPITVDEMLLLTRAVVRGSRRAPVVADMPFGSFQTSDKAALKNGVRFVKEAGADAVKLEGAGPTLSRAGALVDAGIPVMAHIGLTPQSVKLLGGYKPQGMTAAAARNLVEGARALERAGCCAIFLEAIPAPVAAVISHALTIPTIGIGAGSSCDGQVLVWHDILGLTAGHVPRFVKQYANIGDEILKALQAYVADVRLGHFPERQHTYPMPEDERRLFESALVTAFDE